MLPIFLYTDLDSRVGLIELGKPSLERLQVSLPDYLHGHPYNRLSLLKCVCMQAVRWLAALLVCDMHAYLPAGMKCPNHVPARSWRGGLGMPVSRIRLPT